MIWLSVNRRVNLWMLLIASYIHTICRRRKNRKTKPLFSLEPRVVFKIAAHKVNEYPVVKATEKGETIFV